MTIPDSVTSIGDYAFDGCSGLTSITIPDSVTSIGLCAFYGCSRLMSITIGAGVTSIGSSAFSGCGGLTNFVVGANNRNYCSVNGLLLTKNGKTLIAGVNGEITIPDSVTSIGSSAFRGCSGLTSVTIPDNVTSTSGGGRSLVATLLFTTRRRFLVLGLWMAGLLERRVRCRVR